VDGATPNYRKKLIMQLTIISDTHGQHRGLAMPESDIVIHAGDFSRKGRPHEIEDFMDWYSQLPHPHKILIAGNHDLLAENEPDFFRRLIPNNITYLENTGVTVEGLTFWGSPITPYFLNWAFNRHRGEDIRRYWEQIPKEVDILITHGPPHNVLDKTIFGMRVGCKDLMEAITTIQPRYHIFGHIHEAHGMETLGPTTFINASVVGGRWAGLRAPIILEV
jgi:Icc-related predicted phosphoesterase